MLVVIDRFEGDFAVCEKDIGDIMNIPRNKLPPEAKEGDILSVNSEVINIDKAGTKKQKNKIDDLTNDLWG